MSGGGAERVLTQIADNLSKDNEVVLVAAYKTENEYFRSQKVKTIYIDDGINNKHSIRQIYRLRKIVKNENADICLSFLPQPNFKMILASLGINAKVVVSVRNDPKMEYASLFSRILSKLLYPLADGIVFQTQEAKAWFPKKIQDKSAIIMNQVDEIFFNTSRLSEDYWVATGRLTQQKNYPLMIKAFKKLVLNYPDEVLHIYGEGEKQEEIEKLIEELQLSNNVFLMGSTDNVVEVLRHAKCFLLSSDYEGMPNGLLEAMAVGLPSIATDCPCGGPREIIKTGENGILIGVGKVEELYEGMKLIVENTDIRNKFSLNASKTSRVYRSKEVFNKWEQFFSKIRGR